MATFLVNNSLIVDHCVALQFGMWQMCSRVDCIVVFWEQYCKCMGYEFVISFGLRIQVVYFTIFQMYNLSLLVQSVSRDGNRILRKGSKIMKVWFCMSMGSVASTNYVNGLNPTWLTILNWFQTIKSTKSRFHLW